MAKGIAFLLLSATVALGAPREQVVTIVAQIKRADYEGDRAALQRLHGEITPFVEAYEKDNRMAARVLYWSGFALWRRAINGFNDKVDAAEQQSDLKQAQVEFEESARRDPAFVDAKIGVLSCMGLIGYSIRQSQPDPVKMQELFAQWREQRKEIEAIAPGNPRLIWVLGPSIWLMPKENGGGQANAMAMYEKGLEAIRKPGARSSDPLEPSWGEPELLMNLAWSYLHQTTPDIAGAQQNADAALKIVPYWHYVRDILMPQIQEAQKKQN